MSTAEGLVEQIRSVAVDEHDKGDRFEQSMAHAFRTDRTYAAQFTDVWRWMDWPARPGPDIGIDLVARAADGGLVAIQCKCYAPTATLTKDEIDSFIAISGQQQWTRRIVVATTDLWSEHAESALAGHAVPIERIGLDDLEAMTVDWSSYDVANPTGLRATSRHELRPHQAQALAKVRAGFARTDRGKLVMACGTGKTFTALRIAEDLVGAGGTVLFLAPSIALVAQSIKEWTAECAVPVRPYAVCSDVTAGNTVEGDSATAHDLVIPATTEVADLLAAGAGATTADAMTVVFSTYQSIQVAADLAASAGLTFDLVICDEAHRTAGVASSGGVEAAFGVVHDNTAIPAAKRLYMTATPKLFKPVAVEAAREADAVLASMDDAEIFGEEFHRLGFGEAVERGLLADYRVLILAVDEKAVSESFQGLLSEHGSLSLPDVAKFVGCLSGLAKIPGVGGLASRPARYRCAAQWPSGRPSRSRRPLQPPSSRSPRRGAINGRPAPARRTPCASPSLPATSTAPPASPRAARTFAG
ncbi:MAG: restriction endonuclease [Sporichthyaceae bacterium]